MGQRGDARPGPGSDGSTRPWAIAGTVLAVATVVVTAAGNISLNDALEAVGHQMTDPSRLSTAREPFESSWVRLNVGRAVTSMGSLACLGMALLRA